MSRVYKVIAERSQGWWALSFPDFQGAYSQGADELEVEFMAKDLIHEMVQVPIDEIKLEISYIPEEAVAQ